MFKAVRPFLGQLVKYQSVDKIGLRPLATTKALNLKEIREIHEDNTLVIEGVYIEHPKSNLMLKNKELQSEQCSICASGLEVKHTDVLILSQFVRPDGCMLPRRITGLCRRQQRSIGKMVTMAQKAGLMSNLTPANSKKDPEKRGKWKKFNTYFDESTIFAPKTKPRYKK